MNGYFHESVSFVAEITVAGTPLMVTILLLAVVLKLFTGDRQDRSLLHPGRGVKEMTFQQCGKELPVDGDDPLQDEMTVVTADRNQ